LYTKGADNIIKERLSPIYFDGTKNHKMSFDNLQIKPENDL